MHLRLHAELSTIPDIQMQITILCFADVAGGYCQSRSNYTRVSNL